MTDPLPELLAELEQFGRENDRTVTDYGRRMLNITRDTGEMLNVLVRALGARRVLEVGTSNGYSTLWLAQAAHALGGQVTTVDRSDYKIALAAANFRRAGLDCGITQVRADAGAFLATAPTAGFDLVFLDSQRSEYPAWWPELKRVLRPGGLLVADNALSHQVDMAPFVALVQADPAMTACTVPVGNGEFLATRAALPPGAL